MDKKHQISSQKDTCSKMKRFLLSFNDFDHRNGARSDQKIPLKYFTMSKSCSKGLTYLVNMNVKFSKGHSAWLFFQTKISQQLKELWSCKSSQNFCHGLKFLVNTLVTTLGTTLGTTIATNVQKWSFLGQKSNVS